LIRGERSSPLIIIYKTIKMKKITKLFLAFLLVSFTYQVSAQQDPKYTQYLNNMNVINPAYAGARGNTTITVDFHSQWVGNIGGPETQTFTFNKPVGKRMGIGFSAVHDAIHVQEETYLFADFSYAIPVTDNATLNFGIKAGGSFLNIDLQRITTSEQDPLFTENVNQFNPNVGVGLYYYTNKFFLGVSAPNLLATKHYESTGLLYTAAQEDIHFFVTGGVQMPLGDNVTFKPSFMARAVKGAPMSLDLTANFLLYKKFELGVNYRLDESFSGLTTFRLSDWMRIGYSYDAINNRLTTISRGTHEVMMIFDVNSNKEDDRRRLPEFF